MNRPQTGHPIDDRLPAMMRALDPDRLAELIARAGLTQSELARRVQLSRSHVSGVRSGRKRVDEIDALAIAEALGVDVHELFATEPRPRRERVQPR